MQRLAPGLYRIQSDSDSRLTYLVRLNMANRAGTCNCRGFEAARRNGHACKHIIRALLRESKYERSAHRRHRQERRPVTADGP